MCINSKHSRFLELTLRVRQGSVLGGLLFNIFLNDLFLFTKKYHFLIVQSTKHYQRIHLTLTLNWHTSREVSNHQKLSQRNLYDSKPKKIQAMFVLRQKTLDLKTSNCLYYFVAQIRFLWWYVFLVFLVYLVKRIQMFFSGWRRSMKLF